MSPLQLPDYAAPLCRSNFSFLTGASHPEALIARAQALRYTALAITDECLLSGVVRAHAEARRLRLPLIVGAQMRLALAGPAMPGAPSPASVASCIADSPRLVLLAQSRRGYGNLS